MLDGGGRELYSLLWGLNWVWVLYIVTRMGFEEMQVKFSLPIIATYSRTCDETCVPVTSRLTSTSPNMSLLKDHKDNFLLHLACCIFGSKRTDYLSRETVLDFKKLGLPAKTGGLSFRGCLRIRPCRSCAWEMEGLDEG
jgi:hypothetical protein